MCFFVNNQFRLFSGTEAISGSDNLENVFEENLKRIGKVVAMLDHWKDPIYLTRVWCIFEQYTAHKLELDVTMILAQEPAEQLLGQINRGEPGIMDIKASLSNVDAEKAQASMPADDKKVKDLIVNSVGFDKVNTHVKLSMVSWVATVVQEHMNHMITEVS